MFSLFYDDFSDHLLTYTDYRRKTELNPIGAFPSSFLSVQGGGNTVNVLRTVVSSCKYGKSSVELNVSAASSIIMPMLGSQAGSEIPEIPLIIYSFTSDLNFNHVQSFYVYASIDNFFTSMIVTLSDANQNPISRFVTNVVPVFNTTTQIVMNKVDMNLPSNVRYIRLSVITTCKCLKINIYFFGAIYSKGFFYDNFTMFQGVYDSFTSTTAITDSSSNASTRTFLMNGQGSLEVFGNSIQTCFCKNYYVYKSPAGLTFQVHFKASILYQGISIDPNVSYTLFAPIYIKEIIGNYSITLDDGTGNVLGTPFVSFQKGFNAVSFTFTPAKQLFALRLTIQAALDNIALSYLSLNVTFKQNLLADTGFITSGVISGILFLLYLLKNSS